MARSKKDQISQGALQAFAEHGYSETSMDAIADIAQVAKGTLYYHFKTKEELFVYVNRKGVEKLIAAATEAMKDTSRPLNERLLYLMDEHLRFFDSERELCLLLLNVSSGDRERDELVRSILADYFGTMEAYFRGLQDEGMLNNELDTQTLTSALFGMIGFTALRRLFLGEPLYTEETRSTLIALCKGALGL
ncbi:TetR/AcrR family transcriptional regulator [Brevibacillus sp. B_LB10_24]|uniref:TetR/AcrR family transcriptional regulator n=1 Tax=Brevibacillus sp. B_LB10_24 TaxID=3380645 RepID=UPI0038B97AF9